MVNNVRNQNVMEERLNNIWVGSHQIRVNTPKYQRNDQGVKEPHSKELRTSGHTHHVVKEGLSYTAVVNNGYRNNQNKKFQQATYRRGGDNATRAKDWKGLEFNATDKDME